MVITNIIKQITSNRLNTRDYERAMVNHKKLRTKLNKAIETTRGQLKRAAFDGLNPQVVYNPIVGIRAAILAGNSQKVKELALAAYEGGQYGAVRLAASYDPDIANLMDFEMTYGVLQNQNQQVFLRFALAEPTKRRANGQK
jgi:hypothetical protein